MERSGAARVARGAVRVILGTLTVLVVLVVVALLALRTEWGGSLVRQFALPQINATLSGRLELADFRYRWRSLELRGVVLRDPEGAKVVELQRAWVSFSPLALLRNRIDVREVRLEQPVVTLERTHKGWNLARALAPSGPPRPAVTVPPDREREAGSPLHLVVHRLTLSGGVVQLKDLQPAGLPPIYLANLDSDGSVDLTLGHGPEGSRVRGRLGLQGATLSPVRAPLTVRLAAEAVGPRGKGAFRFAWGGTHVDLSLSSRDVRHIDVALNQIRVEPGLVRRFVPAYPVRAPAEVRGRPPCAATR